MIWRASGVANNIILDHLASLEDKIQVCLCCSFAPSLAQFNELANKIHLEGKKKENCSFKRVNRNISISIYVFVLETKQNFIIIMAQKRKWASYPFSQTGPYFLLQTQRLESLVCLVSQRDQRFALSEQGSSQSCPFAAHRRN